ncbi:Cpr67Fa1, partial [Drosophila busckii]
HFLQLLIATAVVACAYAAPQFSSPDHLATSSHVQDIRPDGSYEYRYETSNGIAAQESGVGGLIANGGYSYYAPDGQLIQVTYTADANGFHPQGAHLPVGPAIPEAILKSLEYIRTHPQYVDQQQQQQFIQPSTR